MRGPHDETTAHFPCLIFLWNPCQKVLGDLGVWKVAAGNTEHSNNKLERKNPSVKGEAQGGTTRRVGQSIQKFERKSAPLLCWVSSPLLRSATQSNTAHAGNCTVSSSRLPSSGKMRSYWRESSAGLRGWGGHWSISPTTKGWGSWACSAWRREGWEGTLEMPLNICRVGVRRMRPDSFQCFF